MAEKTTGSFEKGNTGDEVIFEIVEHYGDLNNIGGKWVKALNCSLKAFKLNRVGGLVLEINIRSLEG